MLNAQKNLATLIRVLESEPNPLPVHAEKVVRGDIIGITYWFLNEQRGIKDYGVFMDYTRRRGPRVFSDEELTSWSARYQRRVNALFSMDYKWVN